MDFHLRPAVLNIIHTRNEDQNRSFNYKNYSSNIYNRYYILNTYCVSDVLFRAILKFLSNCSRAYNNA